MSDKTKIAWCDSTVNFWSGCTKVSPGCANCYAEARDARMMQEKVIHWGKGAPRLKHVGAVKQALAMNRKPWICDKCSEASDHQGPCQSNISKPPSTPWICGGSKHRRRIFSLSLGDWLDNEVPIEWLAEMLDTIRQCDQVTWILCTKRPENWSDRLHAAMRVIHNETDAFISYWLDGYAPKHVVLLASVENQAMADLRIPQLLKIPAACRGLSLEPLLGPVDLQNITDAKRFPGAASFDVVNGRMIHHDDDMNWTPDGKVDWLIIGGESGPGARACGVENIRSLVEQGKSARVATFVKQLGSNSTIGTIYDKKGGNPDEWPQALRVQQWPKGF